MRVSAASNKFTPTPGGLTGRHTRQRGVTIMEILVACLVLALLGLLTIALFRTGASGWRKLEAQSTLLADYEVLEAKLSREAQRSCFVSASTTVGPNGSTLAFLSAMNDDGVFAIDPLSYQPVWQKYLVFYYDQNARRIYLAEVPLVPGSPEISAPQRLEDYDAGTGSLEDYRHDGRLLMTDVDTCNFSLLDSILSFEIAGSRKRYGDTEPEILRMAGSAGFRN